VASTALSKFEAVHQSIEGRFGGTYLAALAKNTKRCEEIVKHVQDPDQPSEKSQKDLFLDVARELDVRLDEDQLRRTIGKLATVKDAEKPKGGSRDGS